MSELIRGRSLPAWLSGLAIVGGSRAFSGMRELRERSGVPKWQ